MASSSSCSHFIDTSVSQSWNHDVFLSFRGDDTRKGFVGHLYKALVQQGIQTYKDDKTLARGESIGPALQKAIQESRIACIVFSKNYADSSWCLDELVHIIECKDKRGQIVMPVFYDVDPSDVRKQKRKYGEAFIKHECDNKHKIESWRKALVEASNLSGWVLKDYANGNEAKCIKDIVAIIFSRLSPPITNVNNDLIGIETRLQDLKSKLKIGSGGVRMVGIWGDAGGGKTTLASAAYSEISHQFKACCLLENIREESSKLGLKKLQANMLSHVLKKKVRVGSEIEGKSMIKRSLCHKSVILVLDDVDDLKQLDALAGSHDWFGEGSRIIITTRDKHLLTRQADTIHEVSLLSDDEAIQLFYKHAFRNDKPMEDYKMLSQEAISYAGGLPLALEILGSFLYDKDKDEWISALDKLKSIPNVRVMERLKISYDRLERDEKNLFLDIACFFRKSLIDEALMVLNACSFHSRIGVSVLVQKSLIKVSNERFVMHDLVVQMAHYIVRGEHPNDPEKHSRIWKKEDIVNLCAMEATTPLMETEALVSRDHVVDDLESWVHESSYDNHQHLPNVIANMKKLRLIIWRGFPISSFPSNFQPTKLCCLMLRYSNLKQLWEGCKLLPNLKTIDLRDSMNLTRTPDFKGLPCLERLLLERCENLKEIHPSIGYHERLVYVNMKRCEKLKAFPPIIQMKKLETLVLSECLRLQKFPDIQTNMDSLANLHLDDTGIEIIPHSVGQFCTNLVSLYLRCCSKLKRIDGNFRLIRRLRYLKLSSCWRLEKLPLDFFDEECCLEELSLSIKMQGLQCFHQDNPKLPQFPRSLRELNLYNCNLGDGDIPPDMSGLLNLQLLDLSRNKFSHLHSSLSQIPRLKFLDLSYCENLVELPDLPSSIAILKAESCNSLQGVGDLSKCKWLWKVSLSRENENTLIGGERVLHSMLRINAVEDRFMSILLPCVHLSDPCRELIAITLQLPHNWYNDFSGFLFCGDNCKNFRCNIYIKPEMLSMDSQHDHWEEFDKSHESYENGHVGYVPFGSLRHTSWWNPTYTNITFQIEGMPNPKVGLVPRKSKPCDSWETTIDCSECWEENSIGKTFEIEHNSRSSEIKIVWSP